MPRDNILLRKYQYLNVYSYQTVEYFMQNMRGSDAQIYHHMFGLKGGTLEKSVREGRENGIEIKWEVVYQLKQS